METPFFFAKGKNKNLHTTRSLSEQDIHNVFPEENFEINNFFKFLSQTDQESVEALLEAFLDNEITITQNYWSAAMLADFVQEEINNFPISHTALLGSKHNTTQCTIPPFLYQCPFCRKNCNKTILPNINELFQHIENVHQQNISHEEMLRYLTEQGSLGEYTGLSVEEESFTCNGGHKINEWYCRSPGCNACGQSLTEFLQHQITDHNDKYIKEMTT